MLVALPWSASLWTDELPLPRANMALRYSCLGMVVWPPKAPGRTHSKVLPMFLTMGLVNLLLHSSAQHPKSFSGKRAWADSFHNPIAFDGNRLASKSGGSETLRSCCTNGVNRP